MAAGEDKTGVRAAALELNVSKRSVVPNILGDDRSALRLRHGESLGIRLAPKLRSILNCDAVAPAAA